MPIFVFAQTHPAAPCFFPHPRPSFTTAARKAWRPAWTGCIRYESSYLSSSTRPPDGVYEIFCRVWSVLFVNSVLLQGYVYSSIRKNRDYFGTHGYAQTIVIFPDIAVCCVCDTTIDSSIERHSYIRSEIDLALASGIGFSNRFSQPNQTIFRPSLNSIPPIQPTHFLYR